VGFLTVYPELNTHLYRLRLDSTWFNLGVAFHRSFRGRLAAAAQPRYTTNAKHHFLSLGLAAKAGFGDGMALGLEAEPVLLGRDSTTRSLSLSLALEKQVGWHDFAITLGTPREQSAPALFRSSGPAGAYSDVLDVGRGWFRVGFNLLRKL